MNGFDCYKIYLALKRHFNSDQYDYKHYHGRIRVGRDAFEKRKDKAFFYRIGKRMTKKELINFFVANFVSNKGMWIGDAVEQEAIDQYIKWQSTIGGLEYYFKQDFLKIVEERDEDRTYTKIICSVDGQHPHLLKMFSQGEIKIETLIILDEIMNGNLFKDWSENILDEHIWPDIHKTCLKYKQFLKLDIQSYKKSISQYFF